MELVIKIPDEAYELCQSGGVDWLGAENILDAVAKGVPLPKGHGDLKDVNELGGEWVCTYDGECVKECSCDSCSFSEWQCYTSVMDARTIVAADEEGK